MRLTLTAAARAATQLNTAARRADRNRDGYLTTAEVHSARAANGGAATSALLSYHAQHRAAVLKDPEISDKSTEMRFMDVEEVRFATTAAVAQLKRIDEYKGNARKGVKPNRADGEVTAREIRNYGRTGGRLQMEAGPLAAFVKAQR